MGLLAGVGCTASLASDRPKRGQRRIYAALQTDEATEVVFLPLNDDRPLREHDEFVATNLLLACIARACHVEEHGLWKSVELASGKLLVRDRAQAGLVGAIVSGVLPFVILRGESSVLPGDTLPKALFPGAFNPPHEGHRRMAELAEQRLGRPVTWELSILNVDKPPLDYISIRDRIAALGGGGDGRLVAVTAAPTFLRKAELFPGTFFVVGADTLARIGDARYYGWDAERRDEAICAIAGQGCRFLVFGRQYLGRLQNASDLDLPAALRELCDEVPVSEFREDLSSTELRSASRSEEPV